MITEEEIKAIWEGLEKVMKEQPDKDWSEHIANVAAAIEERKKEKK